LTYDIKNSHGKFRVCTTDSLVYDEVGLASYYKMGKITANGEKFIPHYFTAAHAFLPLPCIAEVSLIENPNRKILVRINDRGPFTKYHRIIDLSYGAALALGIVRRGVVKVRVRVLTEQSKLLRQKKITFTGARAYL
jgi:rare lipoprotein A